MASIDELVERSKGIVFPYSEEYADAHRAFAQKMWPGKQRRCSADYNRWKFRGSQDGPVDGLLLAVVDGQVVGQLGLIPVELFDGEQQVPAQWACDLMVDASQRHKGLGSLLLAVGMSRERVTLGSEPSPAADAVMTRLGFRGVGGPTKMVLPLEASGVLQWVLPKSMRWIVPAAAYLTRPYLNLRIRKTGKFKAGTSQAIDWMDLVPVVSKFQKKIITSHIVHDQAFLNWRIPGLNGFSAPLKVFGIEDSFAVMGPGSSVYYLYDWGAASLSNLANLVDRAVQEAQTAGHGTVFTLANTVEEKDWLQILGFLPMRTPFKVIYYHPNLYEKRELEGFHYSYYDSDGNL